MTSFYFEWGGSADLAIGDIWPDGDAPEAPTVDDVVKKLRQECTNVFEFGHLARLWNLDIEDIEVSGAQGHRSMARIFNDERRAAQVAAMEEERPDA